MIFPPGVHATKRLFDLASSLAGLILLSPFLLIIAILVWAKNGHPILYKQKRPGYKGKPFFITKFRTMTDKRDPTGNLLPDSERLTALGRFLRSTSLDELPEIINILKGEMSWVGPRPLLMHYLERYSNEQMRRHDVLPAVTGWAQVNGRNALSWQEKFRLDVWYVDHWSFWLDIRILFMSVGKVLRREGISQDGHATAEEFIGNDGVKNDNLP
jgi:lipopolysaccharide/colanic/teichoic acid biosynthesis glycosyltransferase